MLTRGLWKLLAHCLWWVIIVASLLQLQKLWLKGGTEEGNEDGNEHTSTSCAIKTTKVPFHPFEAGSQKMLVILSYQRSGSTFFADMFSRNPEVFHMFEPLDSLYSSLYATPMKWNVPSDITNYQNGSQRILPEVEVSAVENFLASLLSCDVDALPVETLIHPYLYHYRDAQYHSAADYIQCIDPLESMALECSKQVPRSTCGGRFGEVNESQLADCYKALHNDSYRKYHRNKNELDAYVNCSRELKEIVDRNCSAILKRECLKRTLRVVKTVRATMDTMEPLLQRFPNFRVVHLIRDPRAVVRSRRDLDSSTRGLYTQLNMNDSLVREARLLCQTMSRDVRLRKRLEQKYPGRVYDIIYEDLVTDVRTYARNAYGFLGLGYPTGSDWWNSTFQGLTPEESIDRAGKWAEVLTFRDSERIQSVCAEFFQLVKYTWL